jgi:hypothetical protein
MIVVGVCERFDIECVCILDWDLGGVVDADNNSSSTTTTSKEEKNVNLYRSERDDCST